MDKTKIDVNVSSLLDLKAELYRKQVEFRKETNLKRDGVKITHQNRDKKPNIWQKKNTGVNERSERDIEQKLEEEKSTDKAKEKLKAKAKLYDQMSTNINLAETPNGFLVDFERKVIDEVIDNKRKKEEEEDRLYGGAEDTSACKPEDEWVDYEDSFGRTRRCMKKDVPEFVRMDEDLNINKLSSVTDKQGTDSCIASSAADLVSKDDWQEELRKKWEQQEMENMAKNGPLHYQDILFDDRRSHGVGYYQFSRDEKSRQEQMKAIDEQRQQTLAQREKREKLKQKRKALLDIRLAKVKERKRIREGLPPEPDQDDDDDDEDVVPDIGPMPNLLLPVVEKPVERLKKDAPVREWDIGKPGVSGSRSSATCSEFGIAPPSKLDEESWKEKLRSERITDFAPPVEYFGSNSSHNNSNRTDTSRKKGTFPPPSYY